MFVQLTLTASCIALLAYSLKPLGCPTLPCTALHSLNFACDCPTIKKSRYAIACFKWIFMCVTVWRLVLSASKRLSDSVNPTLLKSGIFLVRLFNSWLVQFFRLFLCRHKTVLLLYYVASTGEYDNHSDSCCPPQTQPELGRSQSQPARLLFLTFQNKISPAF